MGFRFRAKKRAADETLYKKQVTLSKQSWSNKNPDKVLKIAKNVREKAKDSHHFYCIDCDIPLASTFALEQHKQTPGHQDAVAGIIKGPLSSATISNNSYRKRIVNEKKYYCARYDKALPNQWTVWHIHHPSTCSQDLCVLVSPDFSSKGSIHRSSLSLYVNTGVKSDGSLPSGIEPYRTSHNTTFAL